jgi:hypothetical protein
MRGCRWLLLAAILGAGAVKAQQPPASTPAPAGAPKPTAPPAQRLQTPDEPDEGLIEFLGSDDVGDANLWEFLKRAPPRAPQPAAPPPQDVKK